MLKGALLRLGGAQKNESQAWREGVRAVGDRAGKLGKATSEASRWQMGVGHR
jgi:hypothetical protein